MSSGPSDQPAQDSGPQVDLRRAQAPSPAASSAIEAVLHSVFGAKRASGPLFDDDASASLGDCQAEAQRVYWLARLFQKRWADVTALDLLPQSGVRHGRCGEATATRHSDVCSPEFAARCIGAFAQLHLQQWDASHATAVAAIEENGRAFSPRCALPLKCRSGHAVL
jgi:hypothetical protein